MKKDSRLAWLACQWMRSSGIALVWGRTIHLYGTDPVGFLSNKRWLAHELVHIHQFNEHGFYRFLRLYLWEWVKHGYSNNRYEREAREKEHDKESTGILDEFIFEIK